MCDRLLARKQNGKERKRRKRKILDVYVYLLILMYQVICRKAVEQEKQGAFQSQHFKHNTKVQARIAGKPLRIFKQPLPVPPGDEGMSVSEKRGA